MRRARHSLMNMLGFPLLYQGLKGHQVTKNPNQRQHAIKIAQIVSGVAAVLVSSLPAQADVPVVDCNGSGSEKNVSGGSSYGTGSTGEEAWIAAQNGLTTDACNVCSSTGCAKTTDVSWGSGWTYRGGLTFPSGDPYIEIQDAGSGASATSSCSGCEEQ